ncbi:phage major tail tube protein [Maridesulfovibrio salexigens]|uniref:Phage major tail tube protein n=1 Tax=Maridesulfovibrio salexigens (strain ATCC 14822 / DSM 2638 / NCIMB 8403 / VKM B-1763) TaxID=526222 RepID=C6BVX3_MARSD|nr:phage major tail tube protein [Maridesulfovibrio salexigens]ACS80176.1 phage major tail tube protein [Maridesulfovibrio salexigens DSM 2638]
MGVADNVLKDLELKVDGRGYAGNIESFKPPKLSLKTNDHRAGGMDTSVAVEMGMEPLEASFVLTGHFPEVLTLWGVAVGEKPQMTARGSVESWDGTVTPVVINMRGLISDIEDGDWKPGESNTQTFTIKLDYYKREQGDVVLHEIDVRNMVRKINGVDQLEERRKALGL